MANPLLKDLVVNGETVSAAAIAAEAQNHAAPKDKPGLAWRAAARALAVRSLLLQEARRQAVEATPREIAPGRRETAEDAAIRALLESRLAPAKPDEAAARAFHAGHPELFRTEPLWEASHILFEGPGARAAAEATLAELAARPETFERLAAERSACSSRSAGGRLEQIRPRETDPRFEAALRRLRPGEIAPEPVETRFGWHVVRLDAAAEGAPLPFEAARARVIETMEKAAWARAARALVAELVAAATLEGVDFPAPDRKGEGAPCAAGSTPA